MVEELKTAVGMTDLIFQQAQCFENLYLAAKVDEAVVGPENATRLKIVRELLTCKSSKAWFMSHDQAFVLSQ